MSAFQFYEKMRNQRRFILLELLTVVIIFGITFYIVPGFASLSLMLLAFISLRVRKLKWRDMGFRRPSNIPKTIIFALAVSLFAVLLSRFFLVPFVEFMTGEETDLSQFADIPGNPLLLLLWFLIIWTVAAFGEEIAFRGYLMERVATLIGTAKAWWISLVLISVLFGLAHYYQGISGIITSGIFGFIFGLSYLLTKRNMWMPVLIHGFVDTILFALLAFGLL